MTERRRSEVRYTSLGFRPEPAPNPMDEMYKSGSWSDIPIRQEAADMGTSELLDEIDRTYDAMVRHGENGNERRADWFAFVNDALQDVARDRGVLS